MEQANRPPRRRLFVAGRIPPRRLTARPALALVPTDRHAPALAPAVLDDLEATAARRRDWHRRLYGGAA